MKIQSFNSVTEIIQAYKKVFQEPGVNIEKGIDSNGDLCIVISSSQNTRYVPIRDCGSSGYYLVEVPE
ncbi:MAG: hypothetical protein H7A23_11295 [Leptospiraceae bacterium]|nr:hypothetical protein [Leptospiraceae bacterium]MCP5495130.1 hypothetical protein [Leptospiraceae bacterium]